MKKVTEESSISHGALANHCFFFFGGGSLRWELKKPEKRNITTSFPSTYYVVYHGPVNNTLP